MKKFVVYLTTVILFSCQSDSAQEQTKTNTEEASITAPEKTTTENSSFEIVKGAWRFDAHPTQNAAFYLSDDSIYYVELEERYPYFVQSDSFIIDYKGWRLVNQILIANADTLSVTKDGEVQTYIRVYE